jgi:hypothetical protein
MESLAAIRAFVDVAWADSFPKAARDVKLAAS